MQTRLLDGSAPVPFGAHHRKKDLWRVAAAERAAVEEDRRRGEGVRGGAGTAGCVCYLRAGEAGESGGREQCVFLWQLQCCELKPPCCVSVNILLFTGQNKHDPQVSGAVSTFQPSMQ